MRMLPMPPSPIPGKLAAARAIAARAASGARRTEQEFRCLTPTCMPSNPPPCRQQIAQTMLLSHNRAIRTMPKTNGRAPSMNREPTGHEAGIATRNNAILASRNYGSR